MHIPVHIADRPYTIYLNEPDSFVQVIRKRFPSQPLLLITNKTIAGMYKDKIAEWQKMLAVTVYTVEDGERYKTMETVQAIIDYMLEARFDRNTVIIAFGGGVVGDIAGFTASIFLRGISYVQVPSTLLAMVDSSIGGKTGVNHPAGKNLVGSFYQPSLVWIDTHVLSTLTHRELYAGYAEVLKCAFIGGEEMFWFIVNHHDAIVNQENQSLMEAVRRSIEIKAGIVAEDEREQGKRMLLNFGHTFGHALERFFNFDSIRHGEGIMWGIVCAVDLAKRTGLLAEEHFPAFKTILEKITLPPLPSKPDIADLYDAMLVDKKVRDAKIHFILPISPGSSVVANTISKNEVCATLVSVFS